jgi:hypothetical protein
MSLVDTATLKKFAKSDAETIGKQDEQHSTTKIKKHLYVSPPEYQCPKGLFIWMSPGFETGRSSSLPLPV